jgi:hypothetical protein
MVFQPFRERYRTADRRRADLVFHPPLIERLYRSKALAGIRRAAA